MIEFKKDGFYVIKVNSEKVRMYVEFFGYWESEADVPNYKEDMLKATQSLENENGFSMIAIMNDEKPPKLAVQKLHRDVHKIWMSGGLRKGVLIFKTGKLLQKLVISVLTKLSGAAKNVEIKIMDSESEAEAWLDS
jgi:hypothetical protein